LREDGFNRIDVQVKVRTIVSFGRSCIAGSAFFAVAVILHRLVCGRFAVCVTSFPAGMRREGAYALRLEKAGKAEVRTAIRMFGTL